MNQFQKNPGCLTVLGKSRKTLIGILISALPWTHQDTGMPLKSAKRTILSEGRSHLGVTGRPNDFTKWYARRHGKEFRDAAWCAMFLSFVADQSGLGGAVGEFAYTPYWVDWFKDKGRWGNEPRIAALVFYDWEGNGEVDHVGLVERVDGDLMHVIEGNKNDRVERVLRDQTYVAGYGYPFYPADTPENPTVHVVKPGDTLSQIAKVYYGRSSAWPEIYKLNRETIGSNPSLIYPGMRLTLPIIT